MNFIYGVKYLIDILGSRTSFPKRVGIIFAENPSIERSLDFEQEACVFFLLQMNKHQTTFEFQIIIPSRGPPKSSKDLESWFGTEILTFQTSQNSEHNSDHINYWLGITSAEFYRKEGWYFYEVKEDDYSWLITSNEWEKLLSPPSLFEFIAISVYACVLQCLSREFSNEKYDHENKKDRSLTRGCIFDYTEFVRHRRILIANPALCSLCTSKIEKLETLISNDIKVHFSLLDDIKNILNRKWMGTIDIIDSPFFNLKKLYKYDVDRNSGFYKSWIEQFRDNILDHIPEWTVGTIITGTITALLIILRIPH
jgi:hypothetical protein